MNRVFAFSRRLTLGLFLLTGAISVVQADVNDQLVQRITQSKMNWMRWKRKIAKRAAAMHSAWNKKSKS